MSRVKVRDSVRICPRAGIRVGVRVRVIVNFSVMIMSRVRARDMVWVSLERYVP